MKENKLTKEQIRNRILQAIKRDIHGFMYIIEDCKAELQHSTFCEVLESLCKEGIVVYKHDLNGFYFAICDNVSSPG